jgi:DNA-binding NarL/FixJ family response regulator
MPSKLKILIVDDHRILTDGIASMLQGEDRYEVVGKMLDGQSVLNFLKINELDILITDLYMPQMTGIQLTHEVKKLYPKLKVLALSMSYDISIVHDLMKVGISGFILKTIGRDELVEALNEISAGKLYFSREVSNEMMRNITKKPVEEAYHLTDREVEILKLLSQEQSNSEIAKNLYISERTVETHRKNLYRKTNTKTIVGLMKYAVENKFV